MSEYNSIQEVPSSIDVVQSTEPDPAMNTTWLEIQEYSYPTELTEQYTISNTELTISGEDASASNTSDASQEVYCGGIQKPGFSPILVDEQNDEAFLYYSNKNRNWNTESKIAKYDLTAGSITNEWNLYDNNSGNLSYRDGEIRSFELFDDKIFLSYEDYDGNNSRTSVLILDRYLSNQTYADRIGMSNDDPHVYLPKVNTLYYSDGNKRISYESINDNSSGSFQLAYPDNNGRIRKLIANKDSDGKFLVQFNGRGYWMDGTKGVIDTNEDDSYNYFDGRSNWYKEASDGRYVSDDDRGNQYIRNRRLITCNDSHINMVNFSEPDESITSFIEHDREVRELYDRHSRPTLGVGDGFYYASLNQDYNGEYSIDNDSDILVMDRRLENLGIFRLDYSLPVGGDNVSRSRMTLTDVSETGDYVTMGHDNNNLSVNKHFTIFEATNQETRQYANLHLSDGSQWEKL
jgi:hypothetical protein